MGINRSDLENIYKESGQSLYNFALRWVYDQGLAEELVHEAFVKVWQRRETVGPDRLKSYLFKTIQNMAINQKRKAKIWARIHKTVGFLTGTIDLMENEKKMVQDQQLEKLKNTLEEVPMAFREVLLLSYYSEMSICEIAQTLNIAEGTVSSRKNRALKILQEKFKGDLNEPL